MSDTIETEVVNENALSVIERANIDCQIETAKKYPRSLGQVNADMLSLATLDEETAASCFYTLPRGGKTIQGKSVRMAEIAASCWGNFRAASRTVLTQTTGDNPHVVVQAMAHDLQTNTAITIEKRRRVVKKKSKDAIDEDDINLAVNSCAAIAFRDAVFKIIPNAITNSVYEKAKLVAVGDIKSLAVTRQKVVDRLKQMGAKEDRIFAAVGAKRIDDITQEGVEILIGLGTALKDGATTLEEAFPAAIEPASFVSPTPKPEGVWQASTLPPVSGPDVPPTVETPAVEVPEPALPEKVKELKDFVASKSVAWDKFKSAAVRTNHFPESKNWNNFNDVPEADAERLLKNISGLERILK
jgi:hypothetical protein